MSHWINKKGVNRDPGAHASLKKEGSRRLRVQGLGFRV